VKATGTGIDGPLGAVCCAMLAAQGRMSQDNRIPLETFHRHVLVTHLKGYAAFVVDQLKQRTPPGEPFGRLLAALVAACCPEEKHFQEENWFAEEIPLNKCYCAHEDFRHHPVFKGQRYVDFMPDKRQKIASDCFPFSYEIRAPWSTEPMPEPLVREREPGRYYVLDGQLRVIRHWYHNVPNVKVFVYKGQLEI
jgi:hypothetical protein